MEKMYKLTTDECIHCGEELAIFERNRCECMNCRESFNPTYADDLIDGE